MISPILFPKGYPDASTIAEVLRELDKLGVILSQVCASLSAYHRKLYNMTILEHIKPPEGEPVALRVLVTMPDDFTLTMQVTGQAMRRKDISERVIVFCKTPLRVLSACLPELRSSRAYLRGRIAQADNDASRIKFASRAERDAYYTKLKESLTIAANEMVKRGYQL